MWSRLFVNSGCPGGEKFMEYISQYRRIRDEKKQTYGDPLHDFTSHCADQFRYAAVVEDQMTNEIDSFQSKSYDSNINLDPWA